MNAVLHYVVRHGYPILFAAMFAHQIGVPLPGPLFLLSAGALAAAGKLNLAAAVGLIVAACVSADLVWYEAGRRGGDKVLHFIHRFTRDPDFHDRRAKRIFTRYGPPILLVAKFVPGLDAVAPPLAGASRTGRVRFLAFDAVGAALYASVYGALGYLFSHDLDRVAVYASRAGTLLVGLVSIGICAYIAHYKLVQRHRLVHQSRLLRIAPLGQIKCRDSVEMPCGVVEEQEPGN